MALLKPARRAANAVATIGLRSLSTLVLAEHKDGVLQPNTLHALTAAKQLGGPVTVLVAGESTTSAAEAASKADGVAGVLTAQDPCLARSLAEPVAALLQVVQSNRKYTHVLAPSSTFGRNVLPRAAALLDVQAVADVAEVKDSSTFVRPIYAGNALATVKVLGEGPRMLTVRPTAFAAATAQGGNASAQPVSAEELQAARDAAGVSEWVAEDVRKSDRPELGQARVVISGGRALKSAENFHTYLDPLADKLGAAVGASRAAVDAGYAPNDLQAVGISGAIQHVAGMSSSKVIVAINSDADAPMFQLADYGLVGDLFQILPQLDAELAKLLK
ncbi:hypothetical protein CHLNCDRAFT_140308 [Chlorella variabilis]|uniref:Electron transfer flavoprotein subunit alpha n=1 Tax=Chlorella variabilis TaxID=554065 RepID=E1Z6Q9_CHLVA|nr:hypothetical protein CHLNCDRAFT_140308 [Chlorella variabilis]EFN58693.1 hypothetical protein CHLNCDRAFT_140308 [Chlorella variabilis]|eukprot:XP_005850795.1 hypothetical protein CHLNCDRAFT_140308 [Chlorella variabilis]